MVFHILFMGTHTQFRSLILYFSTFIASVDTSVLKQHYEKKLLEIEHHKKAYQVLELKRKQDAQSQLLRQKQKSDEAAKRLHEEIQRIKTQKVQLQHKIKQESEQCRLWKASREKEVLQRLHATMEHSKEISMFTIDLLDKIGEESRKLQDHTSRAYEVQTKSIADFQKAYEENSWYGSWAQAENTQEVGGQIIKEKLSRQRVERCSIKGVKQ